MAGRRGVESGDARLSDPTSGYLGRMTETPRRKRNRTVPSAETRAAERHEAEAPHEADLRSPQVDPPPETTLDPSVAEHEKEMLQRGARQRGEGRIP